MDIKARDDFNERIADLQPAHKLDGHHTGYRSSGILGDDGTHGLDKYSRRRTAYTSWREKTAADLMPVQA